MAKNKIKKKVFIWGDIGTIKVFKHNFNEEKKKIGNWW